MAENKNKIVIDLQAFHRKYMFTKMIKKLFIVCLFFENIFVFVVREFFRSAHFETLR